MKSKPNTSAHIIAKVKVPSVTPKHVHRWQTNISTNKAQAGIHAKVSLFGTLTWDIGEMLCGASEAIFIARKAQT